MLQQIFIFINEIKPHMNVAITGAAGYFGRKIIERMERDEFYEKIIGISRREWKHDFKKLSYHRMDVRDERLGSIFLKEKPDIIIHLAFVVNPMHDKAEMHDIDVNGTRNVIMAGMRAGVERFIITSSTMVYGAWDDNPEWLTEEMPMRGHPTYYYNQDKVMVENVVREMEKEYGLSLTILRPCLVLGPSVSHFYADMLNMPFLPLVDGRNPRMQFIHEDDVARAYDIAIKKEATGVYNIVGEGTVRWKEIINMAGRRAIKMPRWLIRNAMAMAWKLHATRFPPEILDFVTYEWVASGEKAKKELGFYPEYSSRDAVESCIKSKNYMNKDV